MLTLSLIQQIMDILHFHILPPPNLGRDRKFERLLIVFVQWTWPFGPNVWYFTKLKKGNLASFLIQEIAKKYRFLWV